jgi:CTP-dependent riboflavin kinase
MDILKRLRIERNDLLKNAKQTRKEAARLLKHIRVIQDIERRIEKGGVQVSVR